MRGTPLAIAAAVAVGVALAACGDRPLPPPSNHPIVVTAPAPPEPLGERDALIAAVMARFEADPTTMPDVGLLPDTGPILIRAELDDDRAPRVRFTGTIRGRKVVVRTAAALQARADRDHQHVHFIRFYGITIDGDAALVGVGVDLVVPTTAHGIKLCCCVGYDRYIRRDGTWVFERRDSSVCA